MGAGPIIDEYWLRVAEGQARLDLAKEDTEVMLIGALAKVDDRLPKQRRDGCKHRL